MILWLYTLLSFGEEGFWTTDSLPPKEEWSSIRPELTNRSSTLIRSIVSLPNCTGAIISESGLVITNAHCIQHYVDRNEHTVHAQNQQEEQIISDLYIYVTRSVVDIQSEVFRRIPDTALPSYVEYRTQRNQRVILRACRKESTDIRCTIHFDTSTQRYQLIQEERINDVRLVHLPSKTDRHSDIALVRLYKENTPLHSVQFLLPSNIEPPKDAPIALLGYPSVSHRYPHPIEWAFAKEEFLPKTRVYTKNALAILKKSKSYVHKHRRDMIQEIDHNARTLLNLYQQEAPSSKLYDRSTDFLIWTQNDPKRLVWAQAYHTYEQTIHKQNDIRTQLLELQWLSLSSDLLFSARRRYGWRESRTIPDEHRLSGYQDKDKERLILHFQQLASQWDGETEKELLAQVFQSSSLPTIQDFVHDFLDVPNAIKHLYEHKQLLLSTQESLNHINPKEALPSNPWLSLGSSLEQLFFDLTSTYKALEAIRIQNHKIYVKGLKHWQKENFYPDADGSLRVSFGVVRSNGNLFPRTSIFGEGSSLLYTYHHWIPFFVSDVDATHGSSGSVTINQQGEWIGMLFGGEHNRHTSSLFYAKNTQHHHISTSNILWYFSSNPMWSNILSELRYEK